MYQSLQGNIGLSKAIDYFVSHGFTISIPLNDSQKYDLVADKNGVLYRVSVKTSRHSGHNNSYIVQLRNTGGGGANGGVVRQVNFDKNACDYVFIYLANNDLYLIPSKKITAINSISVGNKYTEYKVKIKPFSKWIEDNLEQCPSG